MKRGRLRLADPVRTEAREHRCAIGQCPTKPRGGALVCDEHGAELRRLTADRLARPAPPVAFSAPEPPTHPIAPAGPVPPAHGSHSGQDDGLRRTAPRGSRGTGRSRR